MSYTIGVDSGGTFTDCVAMDASGRLVTGKAPSTPPRYEDGVLDAVGVSASMLELELPALLAKCQLFSHGTTVGLNALLTRSGARLGLITTSGFEDTLYIARADRQTGLLGDALNDVGAMTKARPLVERHFVRGVRERVDASGRELVPLDETQLLQAASELVSAGAQAIAIAFLWSFLQPRNEARAAALLRQHFPRLLVCASHEISPSIGEYERTSTAVVNAYIVPLVSSYLHRLEARLREASLRGPLVVMHANGGVLPAKEVADRAILTFTSGPVGGLTAVRYLAQKLGLKRVLGTDVGGTSFDVGLVVDGQYELESKPTVERYPLLFPMVSVSSIGTGGGSLAAVDPVTGRLTVGPKSAGSRPGPACYGHGGVEPTLSDAAVVLGLIDPEGLLGERIRLRPDLAGAAIGSKVAAPLGMSVPEAAQAIVRIATTQMAQLMRRATLQRGFEPGDFSIVAYGGAGPQYAVEYARELGAREVIIPYFASVFSALGAVVSDVTSFAHQSCPVIAPGDAAHLSGLFAGLEHKVRHDLDRAGIGRDAARILRFAELRYRRQFHVVRVPVPEGSLTAEDLAATVERFANRYEELYGKGTGYREAGVEFVNFLVVGVGELPRAQWLPDGWSPAEHAEKGKRMVAWPLKTEPIATRILDWGRLAIGTRIEGPAIVELNNTAACLPPGTVAEADSMLSLRVRLRE